MVIVFILLCYRPDVGIHFKRTWSSRDYSPLPEPRESIRLLYLEPGSGSHRIECESESVQFADKPSYNALSYTWGDAQRTKLITVSGKKMRITENLWNALQSMRHPTERQTLWVDAICINQNDVEEKNQQVPLMAFTYSRAKEVWVWLGHHKPPRWVEQSKPAEWPEGWAVDHAQKYWGSSMYWIYRLVHQEYWKRAWIVQEIGMASNIRIYFGRQSLPWSEMVKLVELYNRKVYDPAVRHVLKLEKLRLSKYKDGQAFSLSRLLNSFKDDFSSVKHDKIYAFLSMAEHFSDHLIPVDYLRSPYDVYEDLVIAQNLSTSETEWNSVDLVYFSALVRQLLSRESSVKEKRLQWFGLLNDPDSYLYDGCGDEKEYICLGDASGNTTFSLAMMDAGRAVANWAMSWIFWPRPDQETIWRTPAPESVDTWLDGASHSDIENIQVRGIIAGQLEHIGPSYSDFLAHPDASKRWVVNISQIYVNDTELSRARGQIERLKALINTVADVTTRNISPLENPIGQAESPRLFIGSDIMMGLIPTNAMVGDMICQFWNSSASAVLRRSATGVLEVVGRAAVITDGQNLQWDRPTDIHRFRSDAENAVDLRLDIFQLTRLSFDTVLLPGTGDPDEDDFPL